MLAQRSLGVGAVDDCLLSVYALERDEDLAGRAAEGALGVRARLPLDEAYLRLESLPQERLRAWNTSAVTFEVVLTVLLGVYALWGDGDIDFQVPPRCGGMPRPYLELTCSTTIFSI